ncbi:hypothetical protein [Magnetospirillum sp. 64-120]|uniref:hypothetical protein n=1 Tax=Magnetospirillum sp. 64-120 TaxID=1895778 RepID=UPI0025B83826|nr:hypothetical protein [Magnetospirillum sp. 64-120]
MHGIVKAFLPDHPLVADDGVEQAALFADPPPFHPYSRSPRGLFDVSTTSGFAEC